MTSARATATELFGRPPDQIALVVADLVGTVELLGSALAPGAWRGWTYDPSYLPLRTYRGNPGRFVSRVASCGTAPQFEVIEPIEGPSILSEFLNERGPGLHHIGYFVESFDVVNAQFGRLGFEEIQGGGDHGVDGDGRFGFFELGDPARLLIEVIEPPRRRREPHFVID
jgi:hypothetical protein